MVMTQRQKFDEALLLLERARELKPGDPNLLNDYAYASIWKGASGDKTPDERAVHFDMALKLLAQAEGIDARNPMIYSNRALTRFFQAKYAEAWREVDRAEALRPGSVDPRFVRDLSARMPRPAK
jgi:tetratricopeptide (TPR) repeat protein